MPAPGPFSKCTAAFVAIAMLGSQAAATAPRTVDPLAVVSIFGTAESVAAVCAGSSAAATAGAATATAASGQAPAAGCVLPVVDAPPPPVAETPPAVAPVAPPPGGIGALPLLLGLAAIVGIAAVVLAHDTSDGEINLPISP